MRPITLLSDVELKTWGDEKIDILVNHFGEEKSHKWKVDGVQHTKTSSPIIDPDATKNEWKQIKILVKAEMYPRDDLFKLWHLINKFHGEQFPNLLILASLSWTMFQNSKMYQLKDVIRGAQWLHPEVRDQDHAQVLLIVHNNVFSSIIDKDVSSILHEWKIYRAEDVPEAEIH
ncbi:uncharacterized protein LOC132756989 [Ruditapes philippinarum]|uniref:uncharacterized protein LOC132756989 n=1 Tax=Ruditapes philippinarum TaxID=129788 RepID=UPI00295ABDD3|nr:uncharacterized protein LOC132756989 [Ruditapes philippinarum]